MYLFGVRWMSGNTTGGWEESLKLLLWGTDLVGRSSSEESTVKTICDPFLFYSIMHNIMQCSDAVQSHIENYMAGAKH